MEHLFNCHGEWTIFFYSLPGIGILLMHSREYLWRFWRFLCGIPLTVWNLRNRFNNRPRT
jgi:hypothetical protein